jgi:hypothetical protein
MTPKTMRSQLAGFAGDDDIAFHVCAPLIKLLSHWPLSSFTDTSVARLQTATARMKGRLANATSSGIPSIVAEDL